MNQLSSELYTLWDNELNSVWKQLKSTLDSNTMKKITADEKTWIKDKENQMKKAGEAYSNGSMKTMVMNNKGAELTRARVYELAEYLK